MRIGFDVDGVLADFYTGYEDVCRDVTGRDLFPPRGKNGVSVFPPCWNWPEFYGYTPEEMKAVWAVIRKGAGFWFFLKVLDVRGCAIARALTDDATHEIYFVTARPGNRVKFQTELWLERIVEINRPTVLITDQKGYICKALELEVYIDDRVENCLAVRAMSPKTQVFCPDHDYNRSPLIEENGVVRVKDVEEMAVLVGLVEGRKAA